MYKYFLSFVLIIFLFAVVTVSAANAATWGQTDGYYAQFSHNGYVFQELGIGLSGRPTSVTFMVSTADPNVTQFYETARTTKIIDFDAAQAGQSTINVHYIDGCGWTNGVLLSGLTFSTVGAPAGFQFVTVSFSCHTMTFNPAHRYLLQIGNASTTKYIDYATAQYGSPSANQTDLYGGGGLKTYLSGVNTNCSQFSTGSTFNYGGTPSGSGACGIVSTIQDDLWFRIVTDVVEAEYVDATSTPIVSAASQTVVSDIGGALDVTGVTSDWRCDLKFFLRSRDSDKAGKTSTSPVVTIHLDASSTSTTTEDLGNGYYNGHGFGVGTYTWAAEGITFPFDASYEINEYPMSYLCYVDELLDNGDGTFTYGDREIVGEGSFSDNPELLLNDLSNNVNVSAQVTEPEPTDPIAWLAWKLKKTFVEVFGLTRLDFSAFRWIRDEINTRAPFAYANAVFGVDWGDPVGGSETAPTLTIPLYAEGMSTEIPENYEWTPPTFVGSLLSSIRWIFVMSIWLGFVFYLYSLGKRIL